MGYHLLCFSEFTAKLDNLTFKQMDAVKKSDDIKIAPFGIMANDPMIRSIYSVVESIKQ